MGDIDTGSAAALAGMLLGQLLDNGVEVDLYHPDAAEGLPVWIREHPNATVYAEKAKFEWDRWYSRNRTLAFVTAAGAQTLNQLKLGWRLIRNHRRRPYDAIFQFSQMELFLLGRAKRFLPPIVVHPCTTAAGELRWHQRESRYALESEPRLLHYVVRTYLHFRTFVQNRELKKPTLVVGPSETFNRLLCADYGVDLGRTRVLRHPVEAGRFADLALTPVEGRPIVLLYASRISTRKGVELVIGLSRRLGDLAGDVEIRVLGGGSMWSDYRGHLSELNPAVATYLGEVPAAEMPRVYSEADALLVPSHYEPGSLVVGEALAAGRPIVASDQVGPIEVLDPRICRVFPRGDLDGFEREVRQLVADLRGGAQSELAELARHEAHEQFSPARMGGDLLRILGEAGGSTDGGATDPPQVPVAG